jgi:hypothetical protein
MGALEAPIVVLCGESERDVKSRSFAHHTPKLKYVWGPVRSGGHAHDEKDFS